MEVIGQMSECTFKLTNQNPALGAVPLMSHSSLQGLGQMSHFVARK